MDLFRSFFLDIGWSIAWFCEETKEAGKKFVSRIFEKPCLKFCKIAIGKLCAKRDYCDDDGFFFLASLILSMIPGVLAGLFCGISGIALFGTIWWIVPAGFFLIIFLVFAIGEDKFPLSGIGLNTFFGVLIGYAVSSLVVYSFVQLIGWFCKHLFILVKLMI